MPPSLEGTKTAAALPHWCSESTEESIAGWCVFLIDGVAGVMAESRDVVQEKQRGRGASSRGFVTRIGIITRSILVSFVG